MPEVNEKKYELGIDEFAVAIGLTGRLEEAKGLLVSTLGQISPEEETGRLLAANNSMFARGLIKYDQSTPKLDVGLSSLLRVLFESRRMIRSGKTGATDENIITHYYHQGIWLEHSVNQGIAHKFLYPFSEQDIVNRVNEFLSPAAQMSASKISVCLPADMILKSSQGILNSYDSVLALIGKKNELDRHARFLAEDIVNGKWRASTIWMDNSGDNQLRSRGFLWIQGQKRLWVINSSQDASDLLATSCGKSEYFSRIRDLVMTSSGIDRNDL